MIIGKGLDDLSPWHDNVSHIEVTRLQGSSAVSRW